MQTKKQQQERSDSYTMMHQHFFSSWSSKAAVSIILALVATGFSLSPVFLFRSPATRAISPLQLTFGHWNDTQPAYSSGGMVAYSSNETGRFQIYTINQRGSHQTQLTSIRDGNAYHPEFSNSGNLVSFIWSHEGYTDLCFVRISSEQATSTSCATHNEHVGIHYSWSQNDQIIAYDDRFKISFYYLGQNKTTYFSYNGTAFDPDFCGVSKLCFSGSTDHPNETAIWVSNLAGSNLTRLSWTGSDYMPQYSPTTKMILYLTNYTGSPETWIVGVNNTLDNVLFQIVQSTLDYYMPPILPKISAASPPAWNPNNDEILLTGTMEDNSSHIVIANTTLVPTVVNGVTSWVTPFTVLKFMAASISEPVWSPDGRSIIYVSKTPSGYEKLFLLNLESAPFSSVYGS